MWRRLALLTCLSSAACGSCGKEQNAAATPAKAPASQKADVGAETTAKPPSEPAQATFVAKKTIRIGLEDTEPVEVIEAKPTPPKWIRKDPGKPKVLMSGKHLRFAHRFLAGNNRGFVQVFDGTGPDAEVTGVHLVDFESGPMLEVEGVYASPAHAAPSAKFGIAQGLANVDGRIQEVVIHTSDGLVVPWQDGPLRDALMVLNHGTGQAWIFVPGKPDERTKYSHWTDLRRPPPAPDRELPYHFDFASERSKHVLIWPEERDPPEVPLQLASQRLDECDVLELRSDGSAICVPWKGQAFADGWRLEDRLDGDALINIETGVEVVPQGSEDCNLTSHRTLDPLRGKFACNGLEGDDYLWSPSRTVRIPHEEHWGHPMWSRDHSVMWIDIRRTQNGPVEGLQVLDMVSQRLFNLAWTKPISWKEFGRVLPLSDPRPGGGLWVLSLDRGELHSLRTGRCHDFDPAAFTEQLFAYRCMKGESRVLWTELVDAKAGAVWRLPPLQEVWLQEEPLVLVGIKRDGNTEELLARSPTRA